LVIPTNWRLEMAEMGTGPVTGPYDPTNKESSRVNYFKAVQKDLNKQAAKRGGKSTNTKGK